MLPIRLLLMLSVSTTILSASEPVTVTVTGAGLSINGVDHVARGLFGVHNTPLSESQADELGVDSVRVINQKPGKPMMATGVTVTTAADGKTRSSGYPASIGPFIECLYDRYQPALQLTRKDWQAHLAALGTSYGEQTRTSGRHHLVEFWNEPYLNWATLPGVSYLESFYDVSTAAPGAPMRLKTTGQIIPGLAWDRQIIAAVNPANGAIDAVSTGKIPRDGKPGETVKLRYSSQTITLDLGSTVVFPNFGPRVLKQVWVGKDQSQKHYWSGSYNRQLYIEMYLAFAGTLKKADPKVELAAGWGLNLWNEEWDSWEMLYRPTIDALHPLMDGLHEHHYGGDTRLVAASYEVAHSYAQGKHGKTLRFWNTEAGGHLDPEQPGNAKSANEGSPLVRATAAMTYLLRDVIHLLARCPDKAYTRAAHHPHENGGDFIALRMLKPLRGHLLETASSAQQVWSVASLDGDRLTLAVFNDRREAQRITLSVQAPPGQRLTGARRLGHRSATRARADGTVEEFAEFADTALALVPGTQWSGQLDLGGTAGAVVVFTLDGAADALPVRRWTQHVTSEVLVPLAAGRDAVLTIPIAPAALAAATAARLRVVLPNGPLPRCTLNGTVVELPTDGAMTCDVDLPRGLIAATNTLIFSVGDAKPDAKPALIASASLWLLHP